MSKRNSLPFVEAMRGLVPRLRRALTLLSLSELTLFVVVVGFASFLLDRWLETPFLIRLMILVASMYGVFRLYRRFRRRRKQDYDVGDFVNAVEGHNTELDGHLANALELPQEWQRLRDESGDQAGGELSVLLTERAITESRSALRAIDVPRSLDLRRVRLWTALGVLAFLVALFCIGQSPRLFAFWFSRNVLLASTPWPRSTHFVFDDPALTWNRSRNDRLEIGAWVIGDVPREISLHVLSSSGTEREVLLRPGVSSDLPVDILERLRFAVRAEGNVGQGSRPLLDVRDVAGQRLVHVLPAVREDLEFYLQGGDNRTETVQVLLHDRPRVTGTQFAFEYPAYLGGATKTLENPTREITIPDGTKTTVTLNSDVELAGGWAQYSGHDRVEITELASPQAVSYTFTPEDNGFLDAGVRDKRWGAESRPAVRFAVIVLPDQEPVIRFALLGDHRLMTPTGIVRYSIDIEDDHGFTALELLTSTTTDSGAEPKSQKQALEWQPEERRQSPRGGSAGESGRDGGLEIVRAGGTSSGEFRLDTLRVAPGDVVVLQASVVDNDTLKGPKRVLSQKETIRIIDRESFEAEIARQRLATQIRLEELSRREEALSVELGELALLDPEELRARGAESALESSTPSPSNASSPSSNASSNTPSPSSPNTSSPSSNASSNTPSPSPNTSSPSTSSPSSNASPNSSSSPSPSASPSSPANSANESPAEGSPPTSNDDSPFDRLAAEQRRTAAEASEVAGDLRDISDALERNDLMAPQERQEFDGDVVEPIEALAESELPESERALRETAQGEGSKEAVQRQAERIADTFQRVADRLAGAGDLKEMLGRLEAIIELQEQVRQETEKGVSR